jgi:hypothetical protein
MRDYLEALGGQSSDTQNITLALNSTSKIEAFFKNPISAINRERANMVGLIYAEGAESSSELCGFDRAQQLIKEMCRGGARARATVSMRQPSLVALDEWKNPAQPILHISLFSGNSAA